MTACRFVVHNGHVLSAPADDKKNARLMISEIVVATLQSLGMSYPETTPARRKELQAIRKQL